MGFGILFTGLLSMTAAVSPLSESETFANMFYQLSGKPVLGFLLGAGVAFLLQSSSATIGILQAIATTGALTFSSVYAIIIGVNIGDCVTTAIVCSIGSKADAKRTGVIHILFNIAGSILVIVGLMLLHSFGVLDALWDEALSSGGIANVHTVFRLVSAIVLLPVCGQFEKLSRKLVKDDVRLGENVDHELSLLDEKFFTSPAIALSGAGEAITTMARLARTGVMSAMGVLEQYDAHTIEVINENEEHIDKLADHVDNYLIRLSPHMPSGHGSDMLNYYIQCFGEFERIGDHAVNLTENAQEFLDRSASLSPTAHQELMVLREVLGEILDYTYKAFAATDYEAARHIEPVEEVVGVYESVVDVDRLGHVRDDGAGRRRVEHDAGRALHLGEHGEVDHALALREAAADAGKHRDIGREQQRLRDDRLRRERVDRDDGVRVHVFDDGQVGREHERLDTLAKNHDAAALIDDLRHAQGKLAQRAVHGLRHGLFRWDYFFFVHFDSHSSIRLNVSTPVSKTRSSKLK